MSNFITTDVDQLEAERIISQVLSPSSREYTLRALGGQWPKPLVATIRGLIHRVETAEAKLASQPSASDEETRLRRRCARLEAEARAARAATAAAEEELRREKARKPAPRPVMSATRGGVQAPVRQAAHDQHSATIAACCAVAGCSEENLVHTLRDWLIKLSAAQTSLAPAAAAAPAPAPAHAPAPAYALMPQQMPVSNEGTNDGDSAIVEYFMRSFGVPQRGQCLAALSGLASQYESYKNGLNVIRDLLGVNADASVGIVVDAVEALVVAGRLQCAEELEFVDIDQ